MNAAAAAPSARPVAANEEKTRAVEGTTHTVSRAADALGLPIAIAASGMVQAAAAQAMPSEPIAVNDHEAPDSKLDVPGQRDEVKTALPIGEASQDA